MFLSLYRARRLGLAVRARSFGVTTPGRPRSTGFAFGAFGTVILVAFGIVVTAPGRPRSFGVAVAALAAVAESVKSMLAVAAPAISRFIILLSPQIFSSFIERAKVLEAHRHNL